jgi:hypothetical protein
VSIRGILLVAVAALAAVFATLRLGGGPLPDGTVLGPDNWEAAKGLLPDEILEHYRRGEYRNRILDLAAPGMVDIQNPPDFREASRANRGRYALGPRGAIVDAKSGEQPARIMGLPFPEIDPADPQAGARVVWNYFYTMYYRGNCHFLTEIVMLSRRGVERRITTDVRMRLYDGSPESAAGPNPQNLFLQTLANIVAPADLSGTVSLTWRFRDPGQPDALWTYVPGTRRPRQVNPLNRSDGFMGSDLSIDDGAFFDGKPEDFTFRLLERREQLVLMDPYSLRGEVELVAVPGGGWRTVWKDVPRIGADDPGWTGLPWAPVSAVLVRRPVWIVEAVPKDPNYLYGRLVLRLDAETYRGSWASKYDRAGTLVNSYQISSGAFFTPDGGRTYVSSGGIAVQTAENFQYKRATVTLFPPRNPDNPADWRVPLKPDLFGVDVLARLGR